MKPQHAHAYDFDAALRGNGFASVANLLTKAQCEEIRGLYDNQENFRTRIDMARHRFGKGEYQYFRYPLPPVVAALRENPYARVVYSARAWIANSGSKRPSPIGTPISSTSAAPRANRVRRRCCFDTAAATTTVSIRISTVRSCFPSRSSSR